MAITGQITINNILGLSLSADPTTSGGISAGIGSFGGTTDGSGLFVKTGAGDTAWSKVATLVSGLLPITQGGSGQSTANAALNAFLPSQTTNANKFLQTDGANTSWVSGNAGSVTSVSVVTNQGVSGSVATATTTPAITLALGVLTGVTSFNGLVITANTGDITTGTWSATAIGATKGGTGQTVYAVGDILSADTTTTLSKIAAVATGNALISGGTNTLSSWGKIGLTTHVSGILAGTNGGTGVNNGTFLITVSGNLTTTGAFNTTLATGFTGTITLPTTTSTLATTSLAETLTNKVSYNGLVITSNTGAITTGTWNATVIGTTYGGTGSNTSVNAVGSILQSTSANGNFVVSALILPTSITSTQVLYATGTNTIGSSSALTFSGSLITLTSGTISDVVVAVFDKSVTYATSRTQATYGDRLTVTSAGSSAQANYGAYVNMLAGYTGATQSFSFFADMRIAGTGNTLSFATSAGVPVGNGGMAARSFATTTGFNFGVSGEADGGNLNIGLLGYASVDKNSATNIGVVGFGYNAGSSPIQIGGYFGLNNSTPSFTGASAALVADNGGTSSPIFLGRANGTINFTVDSTGNVKLGVVGNGLYIKEGTNATSGTATLSGGTIVVSTTKVTANSRIYLTINGGTLTNVGSTYVSARTAGTSFTITSTNVIDASTVAWLIIEPA